MNLFFTDPQKCGDVVATLNAARSGGTLLYEFAPVTARGGYLIGKFLIERVTPTGEVIARKILAGLV